MDLHNEEIQLVNKRTGKSRRVSIEQLVNVILPRIGTTMTPRKVDDHTYEDIQVRDIITSKQIVLSFLLNSYGSVSLEVDTRGLPVHLKFSKGGLKVSINRTYMGRSPLVVSSNGEILIPHSEREVTLRIDVKYMGRDINITVHRV